MRTRPLVLAATAVLLATGVPSAGAFLGTGTSTTPVQGTYLRDPGCLPVAAACTGSGLWRGDLAGRTASELTSSTDTATRSTKGTFTEVVHTSDGRLTVKGSYTVDPSLGYRAEGRIVSGTCAYDGASGTLTFTGGVVEGRWSGTLTRPVRVEIGPCAP